MKKPHPDEGSGNAKKTIPVLDDVTFTPDENTAFMAAVIGPFAFIRSHPT